VTLHRPARAAAITAATLAIAGCISAGTVASLIVDAPNGGHPKTPSSRLGRAAGAFYASHFKVTVGPPAATLAVAVVEPRDYRFETLEGPGRKPRTMVDRWQVSDVAPAVARHLHAHAHQPFLKRLQRGIALLPACRPAGTVLLIPGYGDPKWHYLGYALDFADHGYRVVMVDLRGQGESTGRYVTYGLVEHHDMEQVITALASRGVLTGKLALAGFSEGATVALDTAADDPRVSTVIAVAPFVSLRTAINGFGHDFAPGLAALVGPKKLDKALRIADRKVGKKLAAADPSSRVNRIRAPVLYVAGGGDDIAPAADVRRLAARTPDSRFVELLGYPHMGAVLATTRVGRQALAELNEGLGPAADTACLQARPKAPDNARYRLTFTAKFRLAAPDAGSAPD